MRLLLFGCLLALAGCGGGGAELPVSGTVTLDGTPLPNAVVRFIPDSGTDSASTGFATTGTDGKYVITGAKGKKGLVAGKYKVTVSKGQAANAGESEEGAD